MKTKEELLWELINVRRITKRTIDRLGKITTCTDCGTKKSECMPYGVNNAMICCQCGLKQWERTDARMEVETQISIQSFSVEYAGKFAGPL